MAEDQTPGSIELPARTIPLPKHLSAEARKFVSVPLPVGTRAYPAVDDIEGWRRHVAASDAMIKERFLARDMPACDVRERREGEAVGFEIVPHGVAADDRRLYLDIHGGALIMGAGEVCKAMATGTAVRLGARVVAVDYRMPPDHPYPASLDDCLAFYRAVLREREPHEIIVGGGSAGSNLAAAMLLRARDEGLPLPAAAVLISPEIDLTESGDSFQTNAGIDPMGSLMQANRLYAGGADLAHPYISPLFGDFTKGFPPTFITAGTRDLFLSNAARMNAALRAAGVRTELYLLEGAAHGAFGGGSPEELAQAAEMRRFCEEEWAR